MNGQKGQSPYSTTIIDNGGIDTIYLSGSVYKNLIDLNPLAASNTAGLWGNLFIGPDTVIENAIGGSGNDTLIENSANKVMDTFGGNDSLSSADTLNGGGEDDLLNGGTGTDYAIYDVLLANIRVDCNFVSDTYTVVSANSGAYFCPLANICA